MANKLLRSSVGWAGREEATLTVELTVDENIVKAQLHGIGGPEFLQALCALRSQLVGDWNKVKLPLGATFSAILLRELLLKARGEWNFPYTEDETCHCRVVPTEVVDQAICLGAHTPAKVSAMTSASTACGSCRPDVEAMIRYRLGRAG